MLLSKFKGCLIGCLAGDCLGAGFEGLYNPKISRVIKQIDPNEIKTSRQFKYTDDTALSTAVVQSLIDQNGFSPEHMARALTQSFLREDWRGYAKGAAKLFKDLDKIDKLGELKERCYESSMSLFDGSGSFGNGSGMRIAPLGLYSMNKSIEEMIVIGTLATKLTHTHRLAVFGGLLQCFAVRLAAQSNPHDAQCHQYFIDFMKKSIEFINIVENESINDLVNKITDEKLTKICLNARNYLNITNDKNFKRTTEYSDILKKLFKFIQEPKILDFDEIHQICDCNVSALNSIPIALFAFLIASNPLFEKEVDDKLECTQSFTRFKTIERVVLYSISFGGDTDTIASMAASIAGALFGLDIEEQTLKKLESSEKLLKQGENLLKIVFN